VVAEDLTRAVSFSGVQVPVVDVDGLPPEVLRADILVTTSYHAASVRAAADALGKPSVVVTLHPYGLEVIRNHLRRGPLTLVCVDPGLGDRLKSVAGAELAQRVRVVDAADDAAVAELDPDRETILVSTAARARLRRNLPTVLENLPALSQESARELSHLLIRMNMDRNS
jgi:hypothetical protein